MEEESRKGVSLKFKVGILVTGFLSILISIHGFYSIQKQREIYHSELLARGNSILSSLAIPCGVTIANSEIEQLDTYLDLFKEEKLYNLDITHIIVFDHNGVILSHTDQNEFGKRYTDEFYIHAMNSDEPAVRTTSSSNVATTFSQAGNSSLEIIEVTHPILLGLRWGTLVIGFSLERINAIIFKSIIYNVLFVLLFFIMGVMILYLLISRIVIHPIRSLTKESAAFMEKITGSAMVSSKMSGDEIVFLENTFGEMKSRIEAFTHRLESLVAERTEKLEEAMKKLEELAITDGLTGLYNHRYFKNVLDVEIKRYKRRGHKISLLMIDVDDFKGYNDKYGHLYGDACLLNLASALKSSLRETDLIARYGGDEFAVILFDTKKDDALSIAEKLRKVVESMEHAPERLDERVIVTVSVGVATFPADADNPTDLIAKADEAMYRAKSSGRNNVKGY